MTKKEVLIKMLNNHLDIVQSTLNDLEANPTIDIDDVDFDQLTINFTDDDFERLIETADESMQEYLQFFGVAD